MIVVSDAGPLIHLARAEHFGVLASLFGSITIPPAVFHEVCEAGGGQWGAAEVRAASWIHQQTPVDLKPVSALDRELGDGETEAIALARELAVDLLLMDDARGRRVADCLGVPVRGTLGILAEGHRRGMVEDIEAAFSRMRARGTWIAEDVTERVLAQLGLR